ncbi:SRPBCC family protein [Streptomyces sp. NPDC047928]|uniref:SRPBCC family protein n=1 Tax=unclassified Streptomyces TaxID=2593676 RepID=UPI00371B4267
MTVFRIERATGLSTGEAWRRVTDWRAHARQVPLTRVTVATPGPQGVGTRFTARSGVGRVGFDDRMEVVRWEPPGPGRPVGVCRLEKYGRLIGGWAEITVREEAPGGGSPSGCRVTWAEELRIRGVPRAGDAVVARVARVVFGRALDGLLKSPSRA